MKTSERKSAWHSSNRLLPASRARYLIHGAKLRAAHKEVPFDLTMEWVTDHISAGVCEVSGIPFDFTPDGRGTGYKNSFGPSLDRTDSRRGYTQENTKIVVWAYNGAKGTGTHSDVLRLAKALCNVQ